MMFGWILIGGLVYWAYKNNSQIVKPDNASSILKERYVNGEIDEATYEKMKSVIEK